MKFSSTWCRRPLSVFLIATVGSAVSHASQTVTATKMEVTASVPCAVTQGGNITIAASQSIHWVATHQTTTGCYNGKTFALDAQNGGNLNDVNLSTTLVDGTTEGDATLAPGNYRIFIEFAATAAGTYSVIFNRQARLTLTTPSFPVVTIGGGASPVQNVTLTNAGDAHDFSVMLGTASFSGPDAAYFKITNSPSGTIAPALPRHLECNA